MRLFGWVRRKPAVDDLAMWQGDTPFRVVGGRRRKAGIPYVLPWDVEEQNRLDFQHFILRYALRGNYAAPIRNPQAILDVGTGTGRWAIEMANIFPRANVIGLDINPPPVDLAAEAGVDVRPPNYSFVPGNLLEGLPFANGSFDFVHMRGLVAAIPHDRWPFVVGELIRVTRWGGWVESLEATALERGGPALEQLMAWFDAAFARRGIVYADAGKVGDVMRAAGLGHVTIRRVAMPFGEPGGRAGRMLALDLFSLAKGIGGLIVAQGLATAEQFDQVLEQASAELASPHIRCFMPVHIAVGQRGR